MEGLLEAFALLPADVRNEWQLVLVCKMDDGARQHYLTRAGELGIGGRVLLTGFVPDEELALIYQAADLAVCPSLYEGYGLPVAEASACGAPAIASNTSSLVELVAPGATFNPRRPESIAAAMAAALTDEQQRARLVAWSARPAPSWDEVADRAAEVYRDLAASPALRRWRQRPAVALVTPWPPAPTGVAVYNQQLVEALAAYADVDVYQDGDVTDGSTPRPLALPARDRAVGGYDAVILAIGNSEFHSGALHLLRTWDRPMLVHAHDVRLTNLYLHGSARGAVPEGFSSAVMTQYPGLVVTEDPLPDEVYMLREIAARATRLWVTSDFAAGVARLAVDPSDDEKVAVWDYAYPRPVDRDGHTVDPLLICSFGMVNAAKSPELLIDAVGRLVALRPGVRLVFVGPIGEEEAQRLRQRGDAAGLGDALTFTGRVGASSYSQWLARAGLAVQLRRRSNGETSGAVADSLVHGVPTVVSDLGPQAALDDVTIRVAADIDADGLARVLDTLLSDPSGTAALGEKGRRYAAQRGFDWAARQLLELLPELR
jgi:glycosyltransferase involved in cell wall biosynthesis